VRRVPWHNERVGKRWIRQSAGSRPIGKVGASHQGRTTGRVGERFVSRILLATSCFRLSDRLGRLGVSG